ncbi:enoyl-CoA hydratase [Agromyces intestinalis]|uniref:enoyl-CoA hydratase n=1 Tax=Agromyces intestinalis TaxID=2592652 RepID=A0A5C1YHU9_9MICO|nr:enoyl-CoA hydratase-related protein [Agromyces intestinalis]QEO15541.1 enoyl-CoA hydratase [Agromyces intestinalis]
MPEQPESPSSDANQPDAVRIERDGAIATIVIDREASLNALSPEVLDALAAAVAELAEAGPSLRGVLLVGAGGRAFVAGADIRAMRELTPDEGAAVAAKGHAVAAALEALPVPVIACVDGFALGGGLELALACDLIYATDASSFGQPEVALGLIPGFGGTVRLPRAVGAARAKELIYTGRRIGIDEAVDAGLVVRRFADREALLAGARETVELAAKQAWTAVGIAKRVLVAAAGTPTATAVELEIAGFRDAFSTADHDEGIAAFLEKRAPEFPGH